MTGLTAPQAGTAVKVAGEYNYESLTNAVGMTIGLTRATGLFKGSFKAWFDYGTTHTAKTVAYEGVLTPERENKEDGVAGRGFFLWPDTSSYVSPLGNTTPYSFNWSYDLKIVHFSEMVLIPAGTNNGTDPDFGEYSLTVEEFYMDATEITKAQWNEVYVWAVAHGYTFTHAGRGYAANHPVHNLSWYDCATWCNARSEKEGKTPCYNLSDWSCNFSANGYRLPTDTEWEYAARGGLSGKRFPWGDIIDHTRANYYGWYGFTYDQGYEGFDTRYATGEYPFTSPVGAFAANGYGLYDMAGNVWEWCNDAMGSDRYIRGWGGYAMSLRNFYRNSISPEDANDFNGFRTVCHEADLSGTSKSIVKGE
jgi:formylglycine-generating enzyme required for sulfatase activity